MKTVITDDGSATAHSNRYGQTYHSTYGAHTESQHVFLDATGINQRLRQRLSTSVLEIGFGLGLNTLLTVDSAFEHGAPLAFHSIEHDLPDQAVLEAMHYGKLLRHPSLADTLIEGLYPEQLAPVTCSDQAPHRLQKDHRQHNSVAHHHRQPLCIKLSESINAHLYSGDAVRHVADLPAGMFDAIYLDAFSPDTNAECWQLAFFKDLHRTLCHGGILSTYCAAGHVRRALTAAGFHVEKRAGPPGKREILVAIA